MRDELLLLLLLLLLELDREGALVRVLERDREGALVRWVLVRDLFTAERLLLVDRLLERTLDFEVLFLPLDLYELEFRVVRRVVAYGLPNALRVTIGMEADNRAVVSALAEFLGGAAA